MSFRRRYLLVLLPLVLLSGWCLGHSLFQPPSPQLEPTPVSSLPHLELVLDHPKLHLATGTANPQAVKLLFKSLGYEQAWHFFYLPEPAYHNQALFPQRWLFNILPIEEHQVSTHGTLRAPIVYQGQPSSGFTCQPNSDHTQLHCHLFLNQPFFDSTNPKQAQEMLERDLFRVLYILSNQELDAEQYPHRNAFLEQLEQHNLELFRLTAPVSSSRPEPRNGWFGALLTKLHAPVFAQSDGYCDGSLDCKVKEFYCRCPGGGQIRDPGDECPGGDYCVDCHYWDCTGPWERNADPTFCATQSVETCASPMGGICEAMGTTYCATGGDCYPNWDDPDDPPPPPPDDPGDPGDPGDPTACPYVCCWGVCHPGRVATAASCSTSTPCSRIWRRI